MCFNSTAVGGLGRWNWDGDAVVFDTTVPSQRPVVGGKRHYDIDVREFILSKNNAVVVSTLKEKVRVFAGTLQRGGASLFEARSAGAFDFRARVIERWVGEHLRYVRKEGRDPWQFPDETLTVRGGDCEDLAFVMASLLLGAGVSGYHVRVAIGEVRVGQRERYDHAWVVYKNERGVWELIEPLRRLARSMPSRGAKPKRKARRQIVPLPAPVRYVPSFLFNDEHLWIVARRGNPSSIERIARRSWRRMTPKFAGDVHLSILERALPDAPPPFLDALRARFNRLLLVSPLIDDEDWVNVLNPSSTPYDPRQHFDNGLISESWDLLENRASQFRSNRTDVDAFAKAAHAIADFYAHSSYLAFAWVSTGPSPHAELFHPDTWRDDDHIHDDPFYGPMGDPELGRFDFHRFSQNRELWKSSTEKGIEAWNGKIISGRYAQSSDDHHGSVTSKIAESMCTLPAKYRQPELGALPHHAEVAVDDADWTSHHLLFEPAAYAWQFNYRVNTAVAHVRKLWETGIP